MSSEEPPVPLYAATLSDSRLGATTVKGHDRQPVWWSDRLPAVSATTARCRMGARVLASGNARRIPPCGVRRRHLFSCQGAVSGSSGPDARGCVTISAASIRRASSAGVPIRGNRARGFRVTVPSAERIICQGTGLKLALGVEYSTCVQVRVEGCLNCDSCDGCDWDGPPKDTQGVCSPSTGPGRTERVTGSTG